MWCPIKEIYPMWGIEKTDLNFKEKRNVQRENGNGENRD